MNNYQPKLLNAIQQARAPQSVSNESFSELKEQRAEAGESFRNEIFTGRNPETGTESKTWFDRTLGKWIAEFHFSDGSTERLEANSRDDLLAAMAVGHAQVVVEEHEAELEANPVFNSAWEKTVHEWMTLGKWGKRFAEWSEFLSDSRLDQVCNLIRERAYKDYPKSSLREPLSIESTYVALLDEGKLDEFEIEAAENKKAADIQAAENAERDRLAGELHDATAAGYQRAMSEYEQEEAAKRVEADKKLSKTKKGMAELRRRALFGDKTNSFPISTGTGRRS